MLNYGCLKAKIFSLCIIRTMAEVVPKYSNEQLNSDDVSKKALVEYLQEVASIKVGLKNVKKLFRLLAVLQGVIKIEIFF